MKRATAQSSVVTGRRLRMCVACPLASFEDFHFLGFYSPVAQNSPKALYNMVFGPKSLKI